MPRGEPGRHAFTAARWRAVSVSTSASSALKRSLARSGAKMANARLVTLADGSRVFARAAADGGA